MSNTFDKKQVYGGFGVLGLIIVGLGAFAVPVMPVEQTYTEAEPYETTETYTEQVARERTVDLEYETFDFTLGEAPLGFGSDTVSIDVRNTDNEGGNFEVAFDTCTSSSAELTLSDQNYVPAGESVEFSASTEADLERDCTQARVSPGTKQETYYEDVQRERTVTKTREVEKTRTEKVTLATYLRK
ncbi:hypothetical protein [Candidatus Nanohalovita haloferacivicina]|uniref:hypothetical protein n=1 Tax=Candidatus Nanohalovita haloferacivicina TaxID=2978046 RepID=UPI00325FB776|nr:hypothetical protein HBNXNv_0792 [Candidatus Nanohalobia archaeon BNXNv]